jgi:hypothetical protein
MRQRYEKKLLSNKFTLHSITFYAIFVVFFTNKEIDMEHIEEKEKLNHYDHFEVLERFNIEKNEFCETLDDWMNATDVLDDFEQRLLSEVIKDIKRAGRDWNEEELKMNFIALVFFVAKMNVPKVMQVFYERKLSGEVDGVPISVKVDGMIASPTNANRPKMPYFFLQEFKRSLGDDHDPEGQMLAAMLLAQEINKDGKPIYGCWLQGKFWNFTTLIKRNYCVSKTYDASNMEDLYQIVFILRKLKNLILNREEK